MEEEKEWHKCAWFLSVGKYTKREQYFYKVVFSMHYQHMRMAFLGMDGADA